MNDRAPATPIVLASGNAGKLREISQVLAGLGREILPQDRFDIPEVEETGLSFVENAIIKARNASYHTGLPAIGDDSGLEVDALDGAPGIYSSRYAGQNADDKANNAKLIAELAEVTEARRSARFQCLVVYLRHARDPTPVICQGTWEGRILFEPTGAGGFGYDPLFHVPTHGCAAAELSPETKNAISHRGQALRQLCTVLRRAAA